MPPSVKTTREKIVGAACRICRREGAEAINARAVARELGTSTQPIFSNFSGMEELDCEVKREAQRSYLEYVRLETERGIYPPYKASGMAYIRFAKEEGEYFKLLFMRRGETGAEKEVVFDPIIELVRENLRVSFEEAQRLHLSMWVFVHGFATLAATETLSLDEEIVSEMLTKVYKGLTLAYQSRIE